mgnify:FL=1
MAIAKMNKYPRIFVLCYPHFGMLDNWLSVVNALNNTERHLDFTLIIPDASIIRSFHRDNAVISMSKNIFNSILVCVYDDIWMEQSSIFNVIEWHQKNHKFIRVIGILSRLIRKHFIYVNPRHILAILYNKVYGKESKLRYEDLERHISKIDILLYDIHSQGKNNNLSQLLRLFKNNNKYSLPHAISIKEFSAKPYVGDVENNNNVKVYAYSKSMSDFYKKRHGISEYKIHIVGIPRHDKKWINTIQNESSSLPDNFINNTVLVLSRHIDGNLSFIEKTDSIRNIKKIFIDELGMKLVIKRHPNEIKERMFSNKHCTIYEDVLGLNNYGLTWVYSNLHTFALAKGKKLVVSLYTGVAIDVVVMKTPCVEYIESSIKSKNHNNMDKKLTLFVKYGFISGVLGCHELSDYFKKLNQSPDEMSNISMNTYKKFFPIIDNISMKIANEILYENKVN